MKLNVKVYCFLLAFVITLTLVLLVKWPIQLNTSLYEMLPNQSVNLPQTVQSQYASFINVIVEAEDFETAKIAADKFYAELERNGIQNIIYRFPENLTAKAMQYVQDHPYSFLSNKDRKNILTDNTSLITEESIEFVTTSILISVMDLKKDPFSLVNKYVMNLVDSPAKWQIKDNVLWQSRNKINYIFIRVPLDTSNMTYANGLIQKIKSSIALTNPDASFHISGIPLHTANMYNKSKNEITLMSCVAVLCAIILTFILFQHVKYVFIVGFNLLVGFLFGFTALVLFSNEIHILSFAFGASLIGICIDYSFHKIYSMSNEGGIKIKKELFYSFITTVCCFTPLLFASIPLLKQISIFTIGGLVGTFIWIHLLPVHYIPNTKKNVYFCKFNKKIVLAGLSLFCMLTVVGLFHLNIQNEVSKFYTPDTILQREEQFFYKLNDKSLSNVLIIKGKNFQDVLETEEIIREKHDIKGLSVFLPSEKKQEENYQLIKKLYEKEAINIQQELGLDYTPKIGNKNIITVDEFIKIFGTTLLNQFIINDDNTVWSFIPISFYITDLPNNAFVLSGQKMIKESLDICAREVYVNLFFSFTALFLLVFMLYRKKTLIYLLPPMIAISGTLVIINTVLGYITFFHLISLFIVIGLSVDYTIFHFDTGKNNLKPVLFSFLSSVIGFGVLSIASFNVIAAMGETIAIGLTLSYIISFLLIKFARP